MGVLRTLSSSSDESATLGVAAPLSVETHSSSSVVGAPEARVKFGFCFAPFCLVLIGGSSRFEAGGWICSLDCTLDCTRGPGGRWPFGAMVDAEADDGGLAPKNAVVYGGFLE